MRTDELQKTILLTLNDKEMYGYEIHKRLESNGIIVEFSRLYRLLNEMTEKKLLAGHWESSQIGPEKRVYSISSTGRNELEKVLMKAIETVHYWYGNYLLNLPEEKSVFTNISRCSPKE
jgi:DNA-binding PadR family transcriptional regulator